MPTTIQEQLLAGVHQLEKAVQRLPEAKRPAFAAELETLLAEIREADTDEKIALCFPKLNPLAVRITQDIPRPTR